MTFGDVLSVSADDEPVKIETYKGYQLVINSLEQVSDALEDSHGQGRAAIKETDRYDWDNEVEINTLEVMTWFDFEAIATMNVSANRNDPVEAYTS